MKKLEELSVVCGHIRIHSTRVPGSPGFSALMVERREAGGTTWHPVDVFSLDVWCSSHDARKEMVDLINEYREQGYILCSDLPAALAA